MTTVLFFLVALLAVAVFVQTWRVHTHDRRRADAARWRASFDALPEAERNRVAANVWRQAAGEHPPPG